MKMYGLEKLGISNMVAVHYNLSPAQLVEKALTNNEGILSDTGAFVISTGKYTGRAPDDKFFVDTPEVHKYIDWGRNQPIEKEKFNAIFGKLVAYLQNREIFIFDGRAGANPEYTRRFRVINELASQNLFIHQLLIRTDEEYNENNNIDFTIISAPNFHCVPEIDGVNSEAAIIIDFESKLAIICGTRYSGEIKKSVFSIMNYIMPHENILPMHCSANMDPVTHETAIFFGLSGTGKTTLSADPNRKLIGDDEHGWCDKGIFNFEGGCYAKCINLTEESEPEIYRAIKFGSLVENVVVDPIPNAELSGVGGIPKVVIFLTADSFGVLPPISRLSQEAAMYHFVTGFTAKLAGTELGVKEPVPTFSTCFGEPFMPMDPSVYAEMLGERLKKHNTKVYLINTGWSGGAYGTGKRINLKYTRAMVTAVLNGYFDNAEYKHDDIFNLDIPQSCPGVPSEIMNPIDTWPDRDKYIVAAKKLANLFYNNFKEKYPNMPENITNAGPKYND